ncbi:hypothetical protein, variant [Aphanomyces invadans]|uniref:Uncharacterized protein n=1 Tax=Aphanomyces invadans TaxID=157072 RepID=A0A024UI04_9STRA|nr:hypothetical protein, variant [Aphanomyces invadans]ETW05253.1 hypothetical protein, variant [Aphanomyces invadans]|eukprot:XP_008866690.1 hypothetical protein, variant [Aphanomyces invadans]
MASEGVDGCAFLGDLQFLLATEDQLNEDLSLLCDLLSENSPSDQTTGGSRSMSTSDAMENATAALLPTKKIALTCIPIHHVSFAPSAAGHVAIEYPATGARNRFQYRQRQEIRLLRQQVDALKKTLAATMAYHHASNALQRRSVWKQAADQERLACKRAIAENTQLQHAIREQATFIDRMQKVIVKKPRIAAIATEAEAWKSCKLVAHRPLRIAAIHAIADRQLSRMQSALIQAGVFNELNDKFFARAQPVNDNQLVMTFVSHVRIPAPYRTVAASCWQALAEAQDPSLPDGASEECEMVDPNTVYRRFTQVVDSIPAHSNVIRKYYPDGHQDVIVWRNVLEDALAPHLSLGAIDNEWGWYCADSTAGWNHMRL